METAPSDLKEFEIMDLIDNAAELKEKERRLYESRAEVENQIIDIAQRLLPKGKSTVKLSGRHASVTVQFKQKDTWNQEICREVANIVGRDTFHELFKVSFKGCKRPIQKYMAETDNEPARKMLLKAHASEPGKPYLQYFQMEVN